MNTRPLLIILLILNCTFLSAQNSDSRAKGSYAMGILYAEDQKRQALTDLSIDHLMKGLREHIAGDSEMIPSTAHTNYRIFLNDPNRHSTDSNTNNTNTNMTNKREKASYALGVLYADKLKQDGLTDLDMDLVNRGMKEHLAGTASVPVTTANNDINIYFQEIQQKMAEVNIQKGQEFLKANSAKEGVTELASGLQYEIITEGNGPKPGPTDNVTTHYHGTLIDGTVFDSSVDRGEPASFPVNGVIQGWIEALQLMPTGSKWRLYVPSDMAYGERGTGGAIGPHETLIFEVELISIN